MNCTHCPPEPALWPATSGEGLAPLVAAHLQHCAHCSDRVSKLTEERRQLLNAARGGQAGEPADRQAAAVLDGAAESNRVYCIGGYPVLRLLNVGGQAEVYLARHPVLQADVVVKWAHQSVHASPHTARRFADEARLLMRLRHRNLVRVHDVGVADDRPYLVTEYIIGSTLGRMDSGRLPCREAAVIVARVARALHTVHQAGWLHLDVQPDNILIDTHGEPRLIDFGMSAPLDALGSGKSVLMRGGTPEYMAPEQLSLEGAEISAATDVYGLGAVLYELLTGTPPQPEFLWSGIAHSRGRSTLQAVPASLRRICLRSLDPSPVRRFATAFEFAQALEQSAEGRRVSPVRFLAGIVAIAVLCSGRWFSENHDAPAAARSPLTFATAGELAATVESFLARNSDGGNSVDVFLQDGRRVPVGWERHAGSDGAPPPPRIPQLIDDLLSMRGTFLIAVTPHELTQDSPSIPPAVSPLPSLPPGTIVCFTGDGIRAFESGAWRGLRSNASLPMHRLRRVQADLMTFTPQCEALLFASDGEMDSP